MVFLDNETVTTKTLFESLTILLCEHFLLFQSREHYVLLVYFFRA